MSDIKLFRLQAGQATELQGEAADLEKPLQTLIENNLGPLLRIRFLATEYATGRTHAGRIDTLGLDENHCPVILELCDHTQPRGAQIRVDRSKRIQSRLVLRDSGVHATSRARPSITQSKHQEFVACRKAERGWPIESAVHQPEEG